MLPDAFIHAIRGIKTSFLHGRNFRIIIVFFLCTMVFGIIVNLTAIEWILVLLCSACVIVAEMINSAIENAIDLCTKEYSILAKNAKDIAAGATLVFSIFAVAVGLIIFIPHVINLFGGAG